MNLILDKIFWVVVLHGFLMPKLLVSSVYSAEHADTLKIDSLFNIAFETESVFPDSAIGMYVFAGELAELLNDDLRQGQSHHYRAIVMFEQGEYDLALENYNRAIKLYGKSGNETGIAAVKSNMGNIWLLTGDYDKAVELYFQAIETFKSLEDTLRLLISYMNVGTLFYDNNYPLEGLNYLELALPLASDLQDERTLADIHHNISLNYYKLDSIDIYLYHMRKARNYAVEADHLYVEMLTYKSNLEYHIDRQNPDSALYYAWLNKDAAERYGNPYNLTGSYNMAGSAYILANMPDRALDVLHKAHSLGETHGFIPMLAWSNESLAKVYESLGNYREAHKHSSALNALKDSVFKMERQREVLAMDRKYNVAQQQHELEQQKLSIELKEQQLNRRNTLVALSGAFSLLLLLLIFLLYKLMQNKSRLSAREMEQVKLQRDKQMIKALMEGEEKERRRIARELHDGVNGNLAALKLNLAGIQNKDFSSLLEETMLEIRDLSHNLVPDVVKRSGLKTALEQFVHKINKSPEIKVDFQFLGSGQPIGEETGVHIYRIVQELLTNSLKHAGASQILVQIINNEDTLSLTVEDDGKGFEINPGAGLPDNSEGIGLSGVENRVTYMQGSFDIHSSTHSGTSIHIEIPLTTKAQS
ncbi:MAG: hypothetical protein EA361_07800 [Bacteroidetes bacterium]|nr:MAG: hypothetical protein EA361_07800 [Bacteroidota bacterium]